MNKIVLFISPFIIFLCSCGSQKVIATKYYIIEIPMDSILNEFENIPTATEKYCEIIRVNVNPAYSATQIANRSNSRALTYYSHHQWAIRPSVSFSRLILNYFKHVPVFKNVSDRYWRVQPFYTLETNIYHLEVIQEPDVFSARLNIEFCLKETDSNKEIIRHKADRSVILENRDLNLFASNIGDILYQELKLLSKKLMIEIKD